MFFKSFLALLEETSVLKERDYVRLKKAIPGANVPVGSHGRLIYICQGPTLSYLVEFFDSHQSFGEFSLLPTTTLKNVPPNTR